MIKVTRTSELRQLEEGGFKAAIYFNEAHLAEYVAVKNSLKDGESPELGRARTTADNEPVIDRAGLLFAAEAVIGGLNTLLKPLGYWANIMKVEVVQVEMESGTLPLEGTTEQKEEEAGHERDTT